VAQRPVLALNAGPRASRLPPHSTNCGTNHRGRLLARADKVVKYASVFCRCRAKVKTISGATPNHSHQWLKPYFAGCNFLF
jgi:hypothetical protein